MRISWLVLPSLALLAPGWPLAAQRTAWKRDLREVQRTWIRLKEVDCGLVSEYEYAGGSHARFAELDCLRVHTEFRTRQLRERLEP